MRAHSSLTILLRAYTPATTTLVAASAHYSAHNIRPALQPCSPPPAIAIASHAPFACDTLARSLAVQGHRAGKKGAGAYLAPP